MRVVDVAVRQCYRFNCPNCGSRLEADCGDLVDIGGKTSRFWCPVCRKERYVPWSALRKRVVYEDKSAETRALSFLYFAETAAAIMEVIPL